MVKREIYLDCAATTPVYEAVTREMDKINLEGYGNPSSQHALGEKARRRIDEVRRKIADDINARPEEIIFTSGTTESNNLALQGIIIASKEKKKIIISEIEHPSVSEVAGFLQNWGHEVIRVKVDKEGVVDIDNLKNILDNNKDKVGLVSVMHVNNVIGTIQPISEIGKLCKEQGVIFHTDCAQSFGKLKIDVNEMGIDLLSASAHKIGGPKGIGFLYVRNGTKIAPLVHGGGQERGLRSGTENVAGIVGLGKALDIIKKVDKKKIEIVRDKFIASLKNIGGKINGSLIQRIYNIINVSFPGVDAGSLVQYLSSRGIYVSVGSACDSKKEKEDAVLKALGLSKKERDGSIRISIDERVSEKDVEHVIKIIEKGVKGLMLN